MTSREALCLSFCEGFTDAQLEAFGSLKVIMDAEYRHGQNDMLQAEIAAHEHAARLRQPSERERYARELGADLLVEINDTARPVAAAEIARWDRRKLYGFLKRSGYRFNTLHGRWEQR